MTQDNGGAGQGMIQGDDAVTLRRLGLAIGAMCAGAVAIIVLAGIIVA